MSAQILQSLKPKFESHLQRVEKSNRSTLIIKLKTNYDGVIIGVLGRMSSGGSFTPAYDKIAVKSDLLHELTNIYREYRKLYPRRKTLFFRYNRNRDMLEAFGKGTMHLSSKFL